MYIYTYIYIYIYTYTYICINIPFSSPRVTAESARKCTSEAAIDTT